MDKTPIFNFAAAMLAIVNPLGNLPLVVLFVLLIADRIQSFLGAMGIEIVTRLFGLILAAIGVQFILNGLADATVGLINPEIAR